MDNNKFIENNVYNPEAVSRPHTVCIDIPLSAQTHIEHRNDPGYNLADELEKEVVTLIQNENPQTDLQLLLAKVNPEKPPGEYTGDIRRDTLLLVAYELREPKAYSFRWFRNDGKNGLSYETVTKKFDEIMNSLNTTGIEMKLSRDMKVPSYLSSDDPHFWQSIGWKDSPVTEESYLLMFSNLGMVRASDPYVPKDPVYGKDPTTKFDKDTPALNERQKILIRVVWK